MSKDTSASGLSRPYVAAWRCGSECCTIEDFRGSDNSEKAVASCTACNRTHTPPWHCIRCQCVCVCVCAVALKCGCWSHTPWQKSRCFFRICLFFVFSSDSFPLDSNLCHCCAKYFETADVERTESICITVLTAYSATHPEIKSMQHNQRSCLSSVPSSSLSTRMLHSTFWPLTPPQTSICVILDPIHQTATKSLYSVCIYRLRSKYKNTVLDIVIVDG